MITVLAKLPDLAGFTLFVFRRWREDRCAQIAGSLTYTTLLALVPMFVVAAAVLSSAPMFEGVMAQVRSFLLLNLLPQIADKIITVFLVEFVDPLGHVLRKHEVNEGALLVRELDG